MVGEEFLELGGERDGDDLGFCGVDEHSPECVEFIDVVQEKLDSGTEKGRIASSGPARGVVGKLGSREKASDGGQDVADVDDVEDGREG